MIAICAIRDLPHYRKHAFVEGLRKVGYSIVQSGRPQGPEDLYVGWNRYGSGETMADTWERQSGTALICENGYIGRDSEGRQYYAIAAHGHNGSGWWPEGHDDRWAALGIELKPWRTPTADGHILVCGQRGIGSKQMASPNGWHDHVAARLRTMTKRPIRIRPHPGNQPAKVALEHDLEGAWACVIWSSASGVKALINGVPVFYDAPAWICEGAAQEVDASLADRIEHEPYSKPELFDADRLRAFRRMADAQFSVAEIEAGIPFARFLAAVKTRAAA